MRLHKQAKNMSGYITAYICKTANVITNVTAHFHVALLSPLHSPIPNLHKPISCTSWLSTSWLDSPKRFTSSAHSKLIDQIRFSLQAQNESCLNESKLHFGSFSASCWRPLQVHVARSVSARVSGASLVRPARQRCTVHWNEGYEGQFHIFHYSLFFSCLFTHFLWKSIDNTLISDIILPDICGK